MSKSDLDAIIDALDQGTECIRECLEEIKGWRGCALERGWDASALERCRKEYVEPKCPPKTPT